MPKGKPSEKNKVLNRTAPIVIEDMEFWRNLARKLAPKLDADDKWELSELATMLQQSSTVIAAHFSEVRRIVKKTEGQKGSFGLSGELDLAQTPPIVDVTIRYAEKHSDGARVNVPDPEQQELPLLANKLKSEKGTPVELPDQYAA